MRSRFSQRKRLKETNFSQREINDIRMVFIKSWTRRTNGEWRWYKRNWRIFIIIMSHLQSPRNGNTHNNNIQHKRKNWENHRDKHLSNSWGKYFSFFFAKQETQIFLLPFLSFLLLPIFVFFLLREIRKRKRKFMKGLRQCQLYLFFMLLLFGSLEEKSLFAFFFFHP